MTSRRSPVRTAAYADTAGNIHQHRLNNNDWDDDWVFHGPRFELSRGPDEVLLRFLAEMLHPIVRNADEADDLLTRINDALRPDGYELAVVGTTNEHLDRIGAAVGRDPRPMTQAAAHRGSASVNDDRLRPV